MLARSADLTCMLWLLVFFCCISLVCGYVMPGWWTRCPDFGVNLHSSRRNGRGHERGYKLLLATMPTIPEENNKPKPSSPSCTTGECPNVQQIDLLYDSECPICMMEVNFLQKRDIGHRIKFTDISSPDYNPSDHGNVQFRDGMRKIRAVLPDGKVVTGVEVFRQTYEAIGLGWVFGVTNLPVIGPMADQLYDIWAENRLRLTGRFEMADELSSRSKNLREMDPIDECETDACGLDFGDLDDDDQDHSTMFSG